MRWCLYRVEIYSKTVSRKLLRECVVLVARWSKFQGGHKKGVNFTFTQIWMTVVLDYLLGSYWPCHYDKTCFENCGCFIIVGLTWRALHFSGVEENDVPLYVARMWEDHRFVWGHRKTYQGFTPAVCLLTMFLFMSPPSLNGDGH